MVNKGTNNLKEKTVYHIFFTYGGVAGLKWSKKVTMCFTYGGVIPKYLIEIFNLFIFKYVYQFILLLLLF